LTKTIVFPGVHLTVSDLATVHGDNVVDHGS
jgi:hypothetical protein